MKRLILLLLFSIVLYPAFSQKTQEELLIDQAMDYVNLGEYDNSFKCLSKIDTNYIQQRDSAAFLYHYVYGLTFDCIHDGQNAITHYEALRKIAEKNDFINDLYFNTLKNIVRCYEEIGDYQTVAEYCRWALVRGGSYLKTLKVYPYFLRALGNSLCQYEDPDAYLFFQRSQENAEEFYKPDDVNFYFSGLALANFYYEHGEIEKAKNELARLITLCNKVFYKEYDLVDLFDIMKQMDVRFENLPSEVYNDTIIKFKVKERPLAWLIEKPYDEKVDFSRMFLENGPDTMLYNISKNELPKYQKLEKAEDVAPYVIYSSALASVYTELGMHFQADSILWSTVDHLTERSATCAFEHLLENRFAGICLPIKNNLDGNMWLSRSERDMNYYQWYDYSYIEFLLLKCLYYENYADWLMAKVCLDLATDFYFHFNQNNETSRTLLNILNLIAGVEHKLGNTKSCIPIVKNIIENSKDIPDFSDIFHNALFLYSSILLQTEDNTTYQQVVEELLKDSDELNPDILRIIKGNNLYYLSKQGKYSQLDSEIKEFNQMVKDAVRTAPILSFEEKESFLESLLFEVNLNNYSLLLNNPSKVVLSECYNNSIFTKNLMSFTNRDLRKAVYSSKNKDLIDNYELYLRIKEDINYNTEYRDRQSKLVYLQRLGKEISNSLSSLNIQNNDNEIVWDNIKTQLNADEVAVEIVSMPIFNEDFSDANWEYVGLVVTKDCESPILVRLGDSNQYSSILHRGSIREAIFINRLYSKSELSDKLYNLLWKPLMPIIKGKNRIYISAIGEIEKLNLSAMIIPSGERIGELYDVRYVTSTARILSSYDDHLLCNNAVLYGGVQYDTDSETLIAEASKYTHNNNVPKFAMRANEDTTRGRIQFLEGTKNEVLNLEEELLAFGVPYVSFYGAQANEESVKSLNANSPTILHIATHGYFLQDDDAKDRNLFAKDLIGTTNQEYSLLNTGLLMAGSENSWFGHAINGIEDGILTADEIARLDLSDTRLAILSACESGLGEIDDLCGTMGLQRAFKMAGVKSIIMSLWKVDDKATSMLMKALYKYLLNGNGIHDSLKKAQDEVKHVYPNPYYWAAFEVLD